MWISIRSVKLFFSHEHRDHTGGFRILGMLGNVKVYLLRSFSRSFKKKVASFPNVKLREISKIEEISEGIFTTGEVGFLIKEQSLIVKKENGRDRHNWMFTSRVG